MNLIIKHGVLNKTEVDIESVEVTFLVYNVDSNIIDDDVDEYKNAVDLILLKIPMSDNWTFDGVIDVCAKLYGDEKLAQLL